MHSHIKLGRVGGIEIGLHYSWFIIAILIALSLVAHFHSVEPAWSTALIWGVACITAVLFFVALLLHELAHSLVAKSRGLRVRAITLFALGGVSQIESEASDAKSEFWIAIVGPLTSVVIGLVLLWVAHLAGWSAGKEPTTPFMAVVLWLGYINIVLAAFNMIPGFPLDGGRVLRALVWWISGKAERSTRTAARVGQVVAILFIVYGLFRFFIGGNFGGLWLAFIGWFLLDAARSSYLQVGFMSALRGRRVADIMQRDCTSIPGYLSVRDFVDEYLLPSPDRCFVVVQDGHFAGLITSAEVRAVARDQWEQTSLQSIMRPVRELRAIAPDMPVVKALELMARENLAQLPVISAGALEGIFSRAQVMRYLQLHAGLGAEPTDRAA